MLAKSISSKNQWHIRRFQIKFHCPQRTCVTFTFTTCSNVCSLCALFQKVVSRISSKQALILAVRLFRQFALQDGSSVRLANTSCSHIYRTPFIHVSAEELNLVLGMWAYCNAKNVTAQLRHINAEEQLERLTVERGRPSLLFVEFQDNNDKIQLPVRFSIKTRNAQFASPEKRVAQLLMAICYFWSAQRYLTCELQTRGTPSAPIKILTVWSFCSTLMQVHNTCWSWTSVTRRFSRRNAVSYNIAGGF